jgi:hypothetical protein
MMSKFDGIYKYKGFSIWAPGDDGRWIAEPPFESDLATDNYKYSCREFKTIALAKQWVREHGHTIREEDYLK